MPVWARYGKRRREQTLDQRYALIEDRSGNCRRRAGCRTVDERGRVGGRDGCRGRRVREDAECRSGAGLDEEVAEDSHGEGGERGGNRAEPDFAVLVRQGHLLWHGRDFPCLAPRVKFRARVLIGANFAFYSSKIAPLASHRFSASTLDRSHRFSTEPRDEIGATHEPRAWRINRRYDACARCARSLSSATSGVGGALFATCA